MLLLDYKRSVKGDFSPLSTVFSDARPPPLAHGPMEERGLSPGTLCGTRYPG